MLDVDRFSFLRRVPRVELDVREAMASAPVSWILRKASVPPGARCHLCSDAIELGTPCEIDFGDGKALPVHEECHRTRGGMSSAGCMLALKAGVKLVSGTLKGEKATRWQQEMIGDFVGDHGATLGDHVLGHGVTWWRRDAPIDDTKTFIRLVRHMFIHEREAPKFRFFGGSVPAWDEKRISWTAYKARGKRPGPFYAELISLQSAYKQKHGKVERKHPPFSEVLERTNRRCAYCHASVLTDNSLRLGCARDHIFPLTRGGSNELSNFQPLHTFCNGAKNSFNGGHFPLAVLMGRWFLEQVGDSGQRIWLPKMIQNLDKVVV